MNELKLALAGLSIFLLSVAVLVALKNQPRKAKTVAPQCDESKPTKIVVCWGKGEQYIVPLDSIKISVKKRFFRGSEVNSYKVVEGLNAPNFDRLCDQGWFLSYNPIRDGSGVIKINFVGKSSTSSRLMEFSVESDNNSAEFKGTWHLSSAALATHKGSIVPRKGTFVLASEAVQTLKTKHPLFWENYSKEGGLNYLQRVLNAIDGRAEDELSKQKDRIDKENQQKVTQKANVASWN